MGQAPEGDSYNVDENGTPLIAGAGDFGEVLRQTREDQYTSDPGKICLVSSATSFSELRATIGEKVLAGFPSYSLGRATFGGFISCSPRRSISDRSTVPLSLVLVALGIQATCSTKALGSRRSNISNLNVDIAAYVFAHPPSTSPRAAADCCDPGQGGRPAGQAPGRPRPTRHPSPNPSSSTCSGTPPRIRRGGRWAALRSLGRVTTGSTPPSAKEGMFDGAIPFITPGDLESDQPIKRTVTDAGAEASRTVDAGATLVCCIGATIGKIGKSTVRSAFNQQINAVEWGERMHAEYGCAVVRFFKPTIIAWGSSTTLPILKKSSFERVEIPVPPVTDQQEFALRIERVERVRATHRVALSTSNELFSALQVMAFQGGL